MDIIKNPKKLILDSLNGMALGIFATLIVGVLIGQLGILFNFSLFAKVSTILKNCVGVGIGMGIAISLKFSGIKLLSIAIMGVVATSFKVTFKEGLVLLPDGVFNNEPLTVYFVVVIGLVIVSLLFSKKTPVDLVIIPIFSVLLAIGLTFLFSAPIGFLMTLIATGIDKATTLQPFLMSIVIAVSTGMILTSPLSSVAITTSIHLSGYAAGAAVIGTSVQMIGFAIMSIKDNSILSVLSIFFGTSKLQFKNVVKKPIIWLPTMIVAAIIAPISTLVFKISSSEVGAGMGTSGLVGLFQTLDVMKYTSVWQILLVQIALPIILMFIITFIFRKLNIIKDGDLSLDFDM